MANIMSMNKLKNKTSRNGFDLSKKNLFTAKIGELLPVYCKEVIPGDHFEINVQAFARTRPVNTAAYTRIREYYDFFFVPTNLMWNKFNSFVTQMTNNNQHATGINGNVTLTDTHPYFTMAQYYVVQSGFEHTTPNNVFGFSRADLSEKLMSYLGYSDPTYINNNSLEPINASLNPFPLLAYQKIYQDYYRNSQWENARANTWNIDYITGNGDLQIPVGNADLNKSCMFDLQYANWNKDYFMGLLPKAQYGDAASVFVSSSISPSVGSAFSLGNLIAARFNSSSNTATQVSKETGRLFNFTDGATNYDYSISNDALWRLHSVLGLGNDNQSFNAKFAVLALRQAEAKQKWAEITQSQQQDYKSQIEAHFGVTVSDAYSERCKWLGGVDGTISIDAVENTNITGENAASIAGKGIGVTNGNIQFDSKVHGYIMCIYHAIPMLDYATTGIHRQNLKTTVTDYAIPEFDRTGMRSVPAIELLAHQFIPVEAGLDVSTALLGYAPCYIDYKTDYDEVHGGFVNGGLDSWVAPMSDEYFYQYFNSLATISQSGLINYNFFKVSPSVVNPIFNGDATSTVDSDQLFINCAFNVKAVRNLDRDGLPY